MWKLSHGNRGIHVSLVTMVWNIFLFVLKLFAGIFFGSGALISDAVHSISDVMSTVVVIIGIKLSSKKADKEHPYGHERIECVAAIILSVVLFVTGLYIGYISLGIIKNKEYLRFVPEKLGLVVAGLSVVVKEAMYWYTRNTAKTINSGALMADAWHHRSDALSSVGSFFGILCSRLGYPIFDPIASILICFFIIKAAVGVFIDSVNKMLDKSCDEKTIEKVKDLILSNKDVLGINKIYSRLFGSKIYIDVEIFVDKNLTLQEAHRISTSVHDIIEKEIKNVKHCMVYVFPETT